MTSITVSSPVLRTAAALVLSLACASTFSKGKDQPDSRSGHGTHKDAWLIKGTDTPANCSGMVSRQSDGAGTTTTTSCRTGNGVVKEVVPDVRPDHRRTKR